MVSKEWKGRGDQTERMVLQVQEVGLENRVYLGSRGLGGYRGRKVIQDQEDCRENEDWRLYQDERDCLENVITCMKMRGHCLVCGYVCHCITSALSSGYQWHRRASWNERSIWSSWGEGCSRKEWYSWVDGTARKTRIARAPRDSCTERKTRQKWDRWHAWRQGNAFMCSCCYVSPTTIRPEKFSQRRLIGRGQ